MLSTFSKILYQGGQDIGSILVQELFKIKMEQIRNFET